MEYMMMFLHDSHGLMLISLHNSKESGPYGKENKPERIVF